jgi:polysaccharide export outer membrane protein
MCKSILFAISLMAFGRNFAAAWQNSPPGELIQWVRDAKKAGLGSGQIQENALRGGWPPAVVDQAIDSVVGSPAVTAAEAAEIKPDVTAASSSALANKDTQFATPPKPLEMAGSTGEGARAVAPRSNPKAPATILPPEANVSLPPTMGRVRDEYRIGEGDVLQIAVWGEANASVPSGVVRPDGMISMPLIKDVHVAGLTPAEVENVITGMLTKHIKAADVTVIVSQINSKKVFVVGGGVKKEGPIAFTYRMTVMQALSEAGGLTDYAKRKKIYTLRNENGRQYKLAFDYDAVLNGERMELNILLLPGDTLVVPNH